jgi:hypothetical protein
MSPPRHTLVFIPPGSGITRNNLRQLEALNRFIEAENTYYTERNNAIRNRNNLYNRIKQAGGHATRNNAKRVTARPLELYKALVQKQPENTMYYKRHNAGWRKLQEAAGRFKALGKVAAMRKSGNNASPSKRVMGKNNLHRLVTFMTPAMLRTASPIRTPVAHYMAREQAAARAAQAKASAAARKQRNAKRQRNAAAAETARRQAAPTTRSGRKSIAPKPLSPKRRRR